MPQGRMKSKSRKCFEGLVRYAIAAPAIGLVFIGMASSILDKGVPLLIPSLAAGVGTTSLALFAPEAGRVIGRRHGLLHPGLLRLAIDRLLGARLSPAPLFCPRVFLRVGSADWGSPPCRGHELGLQHE